MAERISPVIRRLLEERKLARFKASADIITKELEAAKSDLKDAQASFDNGRFKWATIQAYYSMFHSAKALLYSKGPQGEKPPSIAESHPGTIQSADTARPIHRI